MFIDNTHNYTYTCVYLYTYRKYMCGTLALFCHFKYEQLSKSQEPEYLQ